MIGKNAKKCCCEDISLIENYDKAIKDNSKFWHLHHKLEIELHKSADELKEIGLYYYRPANELIFLTPKEHMKTHNSGENNPMFGKCHSSESKQKMSYTHKLYCEKKKLEESTN